MSMDISVFHSYGLLISENSISKILSYLLPIWKTKEPDLYNRFSGADPFPDFGDYLNTHYDVNLYGNADALRYYRICDQETSEQEIGDYFYFLDLNRSPSLFHTAYADFEEIKPLMPFAVCFAFEGGEFVTYTKHDLFHEV